MLDPEAKASQSSIRHYSSAGGIVVDPSEEKILVLVRPDRGGANGLPEIRLPKGHIERGESRKQAAAREVAEETGLSEVRIVADLGHQLVEFTWQGRTYARDESCFLMVQSANSISGQPEKQFQRLWLSWEEALAQCTYESEKKWIHKAQMSWANLAKRQYGAGPKT